MSEGYAVYTQIKYILWKILQPVSTKLSTVNIQIFYELVLTWNTVTFLADMQCRRMLALASLTKQLACNAMYISHRQSPRQIIPLPHAPPNTHTHTHTHTRARKIENFNATIIHNWYFLSGNTASAGSPLIFELLLHTHLHINHKTNL
jgi:hypothetical protein